MKILRCFIITFLCCYLFGQGPGTAVRCGTDDVFAGFCSADFGFTSAMTISVWAKWNQDPSPNGNTDEQWANIVSNNSPGSNDQGQFWLQHSRDNSSFEFAVNATSRYWVNSITVPTANEWVHIVGVYDDDATDNKRMKLYINGIEEASYNNVTGDIASFQPSYYMKAGRWSATSARVFHGDIDEISIWTKALSAEEVRTIMCKKLNGDETGLAGYWRFDENFHETIYDLTGTGNDGYLFKENGNVTSSTTTTLTDNSKAWTVNEWQDRYLGISAGTGSGQKRTIASNTANTLTVTEAWTTNPDATSKYIISSYDGWVVSGAPLGDGSAYDYSSPSTLSLNSSDGDGIALSSITGSPAGVQVYRVDAAPNVSTAPGNINNLSSSHYFGVFTVGGTSPTYTLTYDYDGHPGITNESGLDLATRSNNAATSWTETNATLNETNNTLILIGQTGTEYILGSESGENPLPVILSSFTGTIVNAYPVLAWTSESESENMGYIIERRLKGTPPWDQIATYSNAPALEGHGTTSEPHNYEFTDESTLAGMAYEYRLSDVNYSGKSHPLDILEINTPEGNATLVTQFCLKEAYPNPFNPTTHISYEIAAPSDVKIIIRDINGKSIQEWSYTNQHAGNYALIWDASDQPSGVYIFQMIANDFIDSKKMVLMK